jgi:hypothetical protein
MTDTTGSNLEENLSWNGSLAIPFPVLNKTKNMNVYNT